MGVEVDMSRRRAGWQRPIAAAVVILAAAIGCTSSKPARVVEASPAPEQAPPAQTAASATPATSAASAPSSTRAPRAPTSASDAKVATAAAEIRSLELREGAPEVFVDLEASAPLVWTSFRNPEGKVVVELPNATPSPRVQDLTPEDGLVASVKVQRETEGSRPMTRLVISTRHEVEHSVTADGLHLQIRLLPLETQAKVVAKEPAKPKLAFEPVPPPAAAGSSSGASESSQPASAPAPSPAAAKSAAPSTERAPLAQAAAPPSVPPPTPAAGAGTPDEPAVAPAPSGAPATRLLSIEVLAGEGGSSTFRLSGDGEFPYSTFALSDPHRFVVDLQGVVNRSPRSTLQVAGGVVQRVRVAQFKPGPKGVARVVFDLKQGALPHVERLPQALVVSFQEEAPRAATVPAAAGEQPGAPAGPAPSIAPAPAVDATASPGASAAAPATETAATPRPKARHGKESRAAAKSAPTSPAPSSPPTPGGSAAPSTAMPSQGPQTQQTAQPLQTTKSAQAPSAAPSDLALRPSAQTAAARRPPGIEVEDAPPVPAPPANAGGRARSAAGSGLPHVAQTANSLQQPSADLGRSQGSTVGSASEKLGRDVGGEQKTYTGEPIDLKVTNADVTEVLRTFAQISGLNIVVQPGVSGTVTAELENVPWDQAFEEVLKINNLGFEREGNVIRIAPNSVLRQEAQERQQLAQARALVIPLRTVMRRLSYARAPEVANLLRSGTAGLLTQRGSVIVDDRTNTLIIKELPDFLDAVLAVISNLDTPEPQVMIEARIIETTKDFSRTLGIQWGFNAVADAAHGNTTGLIFPNNIKAGPPGFGATPGLGNVNLLTGAQNGAIALHLGNVLNTFTLDAQLQAAEHEGLLNILSAPKVATLNNQQAYIQSGIQWPVQTIANNTVTTQYINATLRLEVTPQVTAEGTVQMDINISKKEPVTSLIVTGATNAPISTKDARTRLVVRDGGTAVIGGIYKVTSNNSEDRVPGLASLPIVGHLFRNKSRDESNDELLIFITPRVIKL
jgi:type IV pilus assembly protein PilQ